MRRRSRPGGEAVHSARRVGALVSWPLPLPRCPYSVTTLQRRGFTYYNAVLAPIVDALNDALKDDSQAWLSLQVVRAARVDGGSTVAAALWACRPPAHSGAATALALHTHHPFTAPNCHRARWAPPCSSTRGPGRRWQTWCVR